MASKWIQLFSDVSYQMEENDLFNRLSNVAVSFAFAESGCCQALRYILRFQNIQNPLFSKLKRGFSHLAYLLSYEPI